MAHIPRGDRLLAPMGAGKTTYCVKHMKQWLDGDIVLAMANIENKNYFWYDDIYFIERWRIIEEFCKRQDDGFNIMYSGNPQYMQADYILIPNPIERWKRLKNRKTKGGFCPTVERFNEEELVYRGTHLGKNSNNDPPTVIYSFNEL